MNRLKKFFYFFKKKDFLRKITGNIGDVILKDDSIVCFIDKKMLESKFIDDDNYDICLCCPSGMNLDKEEEKFLKDKTMYYIFENIVFDKGVSIETFFDAKVIFRDCTFNDYIKLDGVKDVCFNRNKYFDRGSLYNDSKIFLSGYGNNLTFINDDFVNTRKSHAATRFGMDVNFDKVELINFNMEIDTRSKADIKRGVNSRGVNNGMLSIKTKELIMDNVAIECPYVHLDCDIINYKGDAVIEANKKIGINNSGKNFRIKDIYSPYIVYNGSLVKLVDVRKLKSNLLSSRQKLIDELKAISKYFSSINSSDVKRVEREINSRSIKKILSR